MAFSPTKEQELAINQKGSILVSAAAGSGKTAVLVERVAKMLLDRENPIYADKLLVVTFTNAAATELRQRIEKRLSEEFENSPTDTFLQKQRILINSAKICTIDSFCLDFIKENFEQSDLSPNFKIADNATLHLYERNAMFAVINECFESEDKELLELFDFLGEDYDDSKLQKCIKQIFDYSRHIPFASSWLDRIVSDYKEHTSPSATAWYDVSLEYVKVLALDALLCFENAIGLLSLNEAAYLKYFANYNYYYELYKTLIKLCEDKSWDSVYSLLNNVSAPNCKNLKSEEKTQEVLRSIKFRDDGKEILKKIETLVYATKSEIADEIGFVLPKIQKIVSLVKKYEEYLYNLLKKQDLITFYIAEQLVLEMLAVEENGEIKISSLAKEYISRFDAILVDEYQDTNTLQDTLFSILSNNGEKLFCVGDMKQCIYKFRGSNPLNFLSKKENAFTLKTRKSLLDTLRIDLGCNFRSRAEICEYINSVFEKILYKENSDFDYDENEKLVPMGKFEPNNELKVETHLLDFGAITENEDDEFDAKIQAEAEVVANIVVDTINKEPFLRGENGLRKANFGDITILIRSMKNKGEVFIKALKDKGIPVSAATADVLDSDEVQTLVSLLKIINNPSDDIALVTVMTSNLFGFTVNDIAEFRASHRRGNIFSAVTASAKNGNEKASAFLEFISKLRRKSVLLSVSSLIDEIFEETNIINVVSAKENGDMHRLNLLCIQNLAASFESETRKDLRSFIKYISEMDDKDLGLSIEGKNAVTVMSIHKSKGLQFPVCILANTANQFNFQEFNEPLLINEEFGFATTYYPEYGNKFDKTLLRTIIREKEKRQLLAEELRVLYVALTRAEEKLILLASFNDLRKEIYKKIEEIESSDSNSTLSYSLFRKSKSYADWIIETAILSGKSKALLGEEVCDDIIIHSDIEKLVNISREKIQYEPNFEQAEKLKEIYSYTYPYKDILEVQSKSSVTSMVHKADKKLYRFTDRPSFMQEKGLRATEKGTAIHKVMQYADFALCKTNLDDELSRLHEYLYLTDVEFEAIEKEKLNKFFASSLCDRIVLSNLVKKEMRFITEFPATEIDEKLDKKFSGEMIVVQGAVDLIFEENGKINILDFKTDRNKNEDELLSAYSEQLKIYAKACEKILNKPIGELIIYSFSLSKAIIIK